MRVNSARSPRLVGIAEVPLRAEGIAAARRTVGQRQEQTLAETLLLPLAFGQFALAGIFTMLWAAVLHYKTVLEDGTLAKRRLRQSAHL